jgi:hypothetical protein
LDCRSLDPWNNIVRGFEAGVDPAPPGTLAFRQFKFLWLPVSIQREVDKEILLSEFAAECDREGIIAPIGLIRLHSMPRFGRSPQHFREPYSIFFVGDIARGTLMAEHLCETENLVVPDEIGPIEPTDFAVLAIGVIIPSLSPSHLVSHQHHGHTERQQCNRQKILDLSITERLDHRVIGWPFDAAIPTPIVIAAISVSMSVCFVVFLVIRDKIIEGESIMTGNEIHALFGFAMFVAINLWTPEQSICDSAYGARPSSEKISYVVPKPAIPFLPSVSDEASNLV